MTIKSKHTQILLTVVLLAALVLAGCRSWIVPPTREPEPTPEYEILGLTHFSGLQVLLGNVQVGDGTPTQAQDGEDLYVEGTSEFDGAAYFDGAVTFASGALYSTTQLTPTKGQSLTPTYTFYTIHASAAVSMTLGTCTAGQMLALYGDDAQTVTVNDTNIRTTDGNAATFGQYDIILWLCSAGSEWIHVANSVNS